MRKQVVHIIKAAFYGRPGTLCPPWVTGFVALALVIPVMLACSPGGGQPTPDSEATAHALVRTWATQTAEAELGAQPQSSPDTEATALALAHLWATQTAEAQQAVVPGAVTEIVTPPVTEVVPTPVTAVDAAVAEIDKVLQSAGWQSDQWRGEVDALVLTIEGIDAGIGAQVRYVAEKSVTFTGEIKCSTEQVRYRTNQDLQTLRDHLLGNPTLQPPPQVCDVQPTSLPMSDDRPSYVTFYGYDLIAREYAGTTAEYQDSPQVRAVLVCDGGEIDLAQWTEFPVHFKVLVKTAPGESIPLCDKESRRIVLRSTSTGANLGNPIPVVRVCPTPEPAPTPMPETEIYRMEFPLGPWSAAFKRDAEYGVKCSAGYHRSNAGVKHTGISGNSGCSLNGWANKDEKSCAVSVHLWKDMFSEGTCEIWITQVGDQLPAPQVPDCDCW
jgi:hypothetical protein